MTAVRADGGFSVEVADPVPASAELAVVSPTGETLTRLKFAGLIEENGTNLKPVAVERRELGLTIDPAAPPTDLRARVSGRVFVAAGASGDRSAAADLEVRITGIVGDNAAPVPLLAAVTDRNGYFAATAQRQRLTGAFADTGSGGTSVRHPITVTSDLWLPEPVLLFIDAKAGEESGCGCEALPPAVPGAAELAVNGEVFSTDLGAGCPDFTIPNRTLEEFDFFKIVRTTDPTIKGLTLPDTVRKDLELPELATLAFDRATLAKVLGGSSLALQSAPKLQALELPISTDLRRNAPPVAADVTPSIARLAPISASPERAAATSAAVADTGIADYRGVSQLEATGVRRAAAWGGSVEEAAAQVALRATVAKIPAAALRASLDDPDGFTQEGLMTLERKTSAQALSTYLNWRARPFAGRGPLNEGNPVDWDVTPEFYQATSIAHGHILHFKQEWRADGYSLGELVRSIPLAPGQKKQVAVLEWDREDTASRTEATDVTEQLSASLSRDRDIDEIANVAFSESLRGGSWAKTAAGGGGFGLAIGPLVIGGGGGAAKASSEAWSDNSRSMSGDTLNQLRDRVSQGASAVRNQRSTVVETVGQSERVSATTEVIANYNRCHALTIQYFEVLRHFAVHERIASVRECLFVPLEMTMFDDAKVLRWHDLLLNACRDSRVTPGFEAIRRLNSPEALPPNRRFADDPIEEMTGRLRIRISIARPKDPTDVNQAVADTEWRMFGMVLRINPEVLFEQYKRDQAKRDRVFRNEIAPEVAQAFLESLRVMLVDRDGRERDSGFAITVASRYRENGIVEVELNDTGAGPRISRAEIAGLSVQTDYELPEFSKVVVESAQATYATERFSGGLFGGPVNDDVVKGDPAFLSASQLSRAEERNQLAEMRRLRRRLLRHLNDNIEYYHRAIWLGMDANRRYMLLDGFEAPRSGGRSVASVVDNRLIGIVGNSLVMPVAPGFQLDPVLAEALEEEEDPQKALERLYEVEPAPPRRLSVPTKGVFAEAMPGKCNSCELIEEDRFWRWKDFPLPDSPSAISPVSTESRFAAGGSLRPTALPDAIVKFQQLSALPDPSGMSAALNLLGQNVFKDLTGLTQNQKNAMAALTTAMGSSEAFADEAFKLAMAKDAARNLDRTLEQIQAAKKSGLLTGEEASKATRDALLQSIAATPAPTSGEVTTPEVDAAIKKAAGTPGGSATIKREKGGKSETVSFKVDESAVTIGRGVAHVVEYPVEIWLELPLIRDVIDAARDYRIAVRLQARDAARADAATIHRRPDGTPFLFDRIQSAINSGLLRVNGAGRLEIRVHAQIGYPADPVNNTRIFAPPANTRYSFVAMVHGNSAAWEFGATGTAGAAIPGRALPAFTFPITERGDYRGYAYLQTHLAGLAEPVVSISFSHGLPNLLDFKVEMRSEMVLAAIRQVMADAGRPGSLLGDTVDFRQTGLMGHSRGGEAVVRAFLAQQAAPIPNLRVRAVCSVAPTDMLGATNANALVLPAQAGVSYLVMYGALDGDVSATREAAELDFNGSGFRLYDRAACDKAMVFVPRATHSRFNSVWTAHETEGEWPVLDGGVALPGVPARALSEAMHLDLAREYIGGFFDLILNGNAAEQPRFRNEIRSGTAQAVSHQWQFALATDPVDHFDGPPPPSVVRTLAPTANIREFAPLIPAAGRDERVPHEDHACTLATAAVGTHTFIYEFPANAPGFDAIRFRAGQLYPSFTQAEIDGVVVALPPAVNIPALRALLVTKQAEIDGVPPPVLAVIFEDADGATVRIPQAAILGNQQNQPWPRPEAKVRIDVQAVVAGGPLNAVARDSTVMSLQTMQIRASQLTGINAARLHRVSFEFTSPAATQAEFWLDSIDLVLV
ncbi:MAG: hypothetical protein IT169_17135 [Bryobacterales bacterium]|nr:hypothetical protein [Bryobacterales bacterium]